MKATLFCLISLTLPVWGATPISFKDITSTNATKAADQLLVNSALGGGNYATRTAVISNVVTLAATTNALGATGVTGTGNVVLSSVTDGKQSAITPTTSLTFSNLTANAVKAYNVQLYGWLPDGTDHTAAATNILQIVSDAGGGVIYFPPATNTYRADGQLLIPTNGYYGVYPMQANMRFTSFADGPDWMSSVQTPACVLDLRYNGTNGAKIDGRGIGVLMFDHLTIKDGGLTSVTNPIFHASNTALNISDCTIIGNGGSTQDAIVLGGRGTSVTNTFDAPFQGYQTRIYNNQFRRLNRGIYCLNWANGVVFQNNAFVDATGTIAIESDGESSSFGNTGLQIVGNLIEMNTYLYGIVLRKTSQSYLQNNFFDPGATVVALHFLTNNSLQNVIVRSVGGNWFLRGDSSSVGATTLIGAGTGPDTSTNSPIGTEIAYGLVVKGRYFVNTNYPGCLVVKDQWNPNNNLSFGFDTDANAGVVRSRVVGTGETNLVLNPKGGYVGIGMTNPATQLDIAGNSSQRNGTTATRHDLYGTFTDTSNYRRGYITDSTSGVTDIGSEGLGTGATGNSIRLLTDGTARWYLTNSGTLLCAADGSYDIGEFGAHRPKRLYASAELRTGNGQINNDGGNFIKLIDNTGGLGWLYLGPNDSTHPGLKMTTTNVDFRVGDDSVFATVGNKGNRGGVTKALTSTTAADFLWIAVPNTNILGGKILYTVTATDGTETQGIEGECKFVGVAKGTAVTAQIKDDQTTAAVSSGTLTAVIAANVTTNNVLGLGVTATTSLTTTNLQIRWRFEVPSSYTVNTL